METVDLDYIGHLLEDEDDMPRITYKSQFGDYGINQEWENLNEFELIHLLANKLGKYEDAEERDENNAAGLLEDD